MELRTPDQAVRAQIDAIKAHLRAEGLADVEDPIDLQKAMSEGFHTIWATFNDERRALRLGYGWLQEHRADELAAWFTEKEIARRLTTDERVVTVRDSGLIQGFLEFPI